MGLFYMGILLHCDKSWKMFTCYIKGKKARMNMISIIGINLV